ncbi:MAG TPA: type II CAAX endopeptidase family protein [Streptosporangiaceae bacterium]|nr:type II CAAX endopeptidase family protein [Streptosporangiaceae bacterium]
MAPTASRRAPGAALTAFARRHQLVLFFALAYAFSWWAWIWYQFDPVAADAPILPFGPFLAALVMLALIGGRPALRAWLGKILHWRVRPVWYAFVLLVPPALTFTAVAIQLATGAALVPDRALPGAAALATQFVFVLVWIGIGEEPAWRGYALPRLMEGRSALAAALVLGVLHAVWHLPPFGVEYHLGGNLVPWAAGVVAASVVVAWVWVHTGGSLLMPILLHASTNTVPFVWRWFAGPDQVRLWWIWAALWVTLAIVIVAVNGSQLTRAHRQDRTVPTGRVDDARLLGREQGKP